MSHILPCSCKMSWSPDGRVLAVGYSAQGVVVWSSSGCRLMSSMRQPSLRSNSSAVPTATGTQPGSSTPASAQNTLQHQLPTTSSLPTAASGGLLSPQASTLGPLGTPQSSHDAHTASCTMTSSGAAGKGPLEAGVSCIAWGPQGYQLFAAEVGSARLAEISFAHALPRHHRLTLPQTGSDELHVLQVSGHMCRMTSIAKMRRRSVLDSSSSAAGVPENQWWVHLLSLTSCLFYQHTHV